jgi:DHA2 family multidrug resistance protein-like MFS transporter
VTPTESETVDLTAGAGRREWLALAVLALPTVLLAVDMSVLLLALPQLGADLGATATEQLWIVDIYGFLVAGFLITMGTIGDRIGRRRLLLWGAAAFAVISVMAAFATSAGMLIAARAALGVAGATLMPSTLALISGLFRRPGQRAAAIAVWMSCFLAGNALGPLIGGALLEFFWWGSVFLPAVPIMLLLLLASPFLLPESPRGESDRPDIPSIVLALGAVLTTVYALKQAAWHGWMPSTVALALTGSTLAVVFVARQRRLADPLLDLSLLAHPGVRPALVVLVAGGVLLGGSTLLFTQFLQVGRGLSPVAAGLWLVPPAIAMIIGVMLAPVLAQRLRPGLIMAAGLAVAALGCLLLARTESGGPLAIPLTGWAIVMFGNGLPAGLAVDIMVGSVPPERAGAASGLSETGTEFGMAAGIALLGSVATMLYRDRLTGLLPERTPGAAEALDGAHRGIEAAQRLPALLGPVQTSYTQALTAVALISGAGFAMLAVLSAMGLRGVAPYGRTGETATGAGQHSGR